MRSEGLPMARRRRSAHPGRPFVIAIFLLCAIALFSLLRDNTGHDLLVRRSSLSTSHGDPSCRQVHKAEDQCAFVKEYCEDEEAGLLSYLRLYYCRLPKTKPLGFTIIALWTALLFTTIGVAASDFFCINLSTISGILGMSESMAGVTFLAFGNGSPDVFSTFAAMKTNSGSLAVGELIGAASFIAAVVAASMALVRPFKVARKSFVRDVGFFIVAVSFSMVFLANGKLELWECIVMVAFYIFYVTIVVVWHWYLGRRRRRREAAAAARGHYTISGEDEIDTEEQYHDDPDDAEIRSFNPQSRVVSTEDMHDLERANTEAGRESLDDLDEQSERNRWMGDLSANMRVTRPPGRTRSSTMNPIRPSLVGALEFQSVLATLQKSRNIQHVPINLRRYSDDLSMTTAQQKKAYSTTSDPEVSSNYDAPVSQTAGPDLDASNFSGRARAVSTGDAMALGIDRDHLAVPGTAQHYESSLHRNTRPDALLHSITPTPSEGNTSRDPIATPNRSRASSGAGLLAPPWQEYEGRHHLQSSGPLLVHSPLSMSPRMRPQLRISPPGSIHIGEASPSFRREYRDDGLEDPISGRPPVLRLPSGDTVRDSLYQVESDKSEQMRPISWWPYHLLPPPEVMYRTLFPTLTNFKRKGWFDMFLSLATAPSFFLLTITLPVVEPTSPDDDDESQHATLIPQSAPDSSSPMRSHDSHYRSHVSIAAEAVSIEESHHHHDHTPEPYSDTAVLDDPAGAEHILTSRKPGGQPQDFIKAKYWNRWLVLIQSFTAPFFILTVIWASFDDATWSDLGKMCAWSLLGSMGLAAFLLFTTTPTRPPKWQFLLCFGGFAVSVAWISTIANEVVGVLKAIGVVFNMSDAILGLTIFAVGNSLGDLVADVTVARLGYPVMALSACFGGPMLNILLGIGLSGSYMVITGEEKYHKKHPHKTPRFKPYQIEVSWTLLISAIGLLITLLCLLVLVPLNGWRMDRRIGCLLVVIWMATTVVNVVVEVLGIADNWAMF
ncbi:hypothetical protein FH972_020952 [Carpinus fangiana]|uniref:Sodium/calcium exchanger membrane region domain-containing protein n=1 Tax=Carpinus fangiana TaxID=176857 RepID=A0A5N6KMZ9_9ROSI|nr:hypothetical protein FH972_020952 [Carpinus fangiana]